MLERHKLIVKILVPFITALIIIGIVSISSVYYFMNFHIEDKTKQQANSIARNLQDKIESDSTLFRYLIRSLQNNEQITELFKNRNREWLFFYTYQTFMDFKDDYGITHLYFHNLDKTNFVRIHDKDVHSDFINRHTLKQAVETGSTKSGIEFGIHHNYTLRVVSPWYERGELIGYIEIGKKIDKYTQALADSLGVDIIYTINKDDVGDSYNEWIKYASKNKHFQKLDNVYIVDSTLNRNLPQVLKNALNKSDDFLNFKIKMFDKVYYINNSVFVDITKKSFGKVFILSDMTESINSLKSIIIKTVIILIILTFLIYYYYSSYIGGIYKKLKTYTDKIELNYKYEQFTNEISNKLLAHDDFDRSINETLEIVGKSLGAHRAYMFLFKDNYKTMDNTHEWCAEGIESQIDNLRDVPTDTCSWWLKQCVELKPIVLEDISQLPDEAKAEKEILEAQSIKSLLIYPIIVDGISIGFFGIDMVDKQIKWSDTHHSFVKVSADSIAYAINKRESHLKLEKSYKDISLTLKKASNGILVINESGKISLYNDKFLEIWEIESNIDKFDTHEELLGFLSSKITDPKLCIERVNYLRENKNADLFFTTELINGRVIETTTSARVEDGVYKGRSFSFKDVTKRVTQERELLLSQKVFDNSLEGILITDSDTNIIKVNNAFEELTDYSKNEIYGQKPTILKSQWHDEEFYKNMWETLNTKGVWQGEVKDRRKNGELYISFSTLIQIKDSKGNISNYIGISRDITKSKENEERMSFLAFYDPLTNLPNRTLFQERLEQTILYSKRNKNKIALMFIDLDNFKTVNDTYGHHIGDQLLQRVSDILVSLVRSSDVVSRLGGDEFTIILKHIDTKDGIAQIAENIIKKLIEPIVIDSIELHIGSSIGIAIYPDNSYDKNSLIKNADLAMYKAKENGKNRFEFYIN